jgi:hypothetical protein
MNRLRTVAYWALTSIVSAEMIAGAFWDLLHIEYVTVIMTHLGYPMYFLTITGLWKIPGGLVLLLPRFQRLKEWAYAGFVFTYTGAVASHLFAGDGWGKAAGPAVFAAITLGSWALRPAERRLAAPEPQSPVRLAGWLVPAGVAVAFVVLALLTLPKGPPPP